MFNWIKTAILMAAIMALFGIVGGLIGGQSGMLMALVFGGAMNLFSYWFSDSMVLKMYNAQPVDETSAPQFYAMVRELARQAGLPMPKVYLIDEAQPNAFATGRNPENAAVAATTGLLRMLSREEVAAVMAHELGHVRNRDTLVMTMVATIAGAISMIANFGLLFGGNRGNGGHAMAGILAVVMAPFAAMIVQMAISRTREYGADRAGAEISGNPAALASALAKISGAAQRIPNPVVERNPAAAQLYIVPVGLSELFSTHPKTEKRIAALQAMQGGIAPASAPARRPSALDPLNRNR